MPMRQAESLRVDITDELASTGLDKGQVARVQELYKECVSKLDSHQRRTNVLNRMSMFFGLPITIFAAVSGTAAFATLGQQVGGSWPVLVIILSLTITVLSTIQTFFRFSEQAAKEQAAANQYAGLLWEIRRWANTRQSRKRTSVDSFVSDVISEMQDTEAEYRGGRPQRRGTGGSSVVPDTTPPMVMSAHPLNNALGVSPTTHVTAAFSKEMEPATFNTTTFKLVEKDTSTPVAGTIVYDPPTQGATFRPEHPLANNTYQATITRAVTDIAENALAQEVSWEFTVGP